MTQIDECKGGTKHRSEENCNILHMLDLMADYHVAYFYYVCELHRNIYAAGLSLS